MSAAVQSPSPASQPAAPHVAKSTAAANTASQSSAESSTRAKSDEPASEKTASHAASTTRDVPTTCASEEPCVPPDGFVDAICRERYPALALFMFEKTSPWEHRYVNDEWLEPINAYGGPSNERWMRFGEEVLLLRVKGQSDGGPSGKSNGGGKSDGAERGNRGVKRVQVSGPDDVDILRSDGTCATVSQRSLVEKSPVAPRELPIAWKYLEPELREALLKNKTIAREVEAQRSKCKGTKQTHPTEECARARLKTNQVILAVLRSGLELPPPEKRPTWLP